MTVLSKVEKFLHRLLRNPTPNDIQFIEMAKFLLSIGCTMRKKGGGSHRHFKYTGYREIITLMENENIREYQVEQVKKLLKHIGIYEEE